MSVYSDFWEAVQDQLQNQLTFAGLNGTPGIDTDAIVIRSMPLRLDPASKWADEKTPGIIISPAYSLRRDDGLNSTDFWQYPLLLQIIDTCDDRANLDQLKNWANWEEQIAKYFHHQNLRNAVFDTPGYIFLTWIDSTDLFDEQLYLYHSQMKMRLALVAQSENPRDPNGVT